MLSKKEVLELSDSEFMKWCKITCPQLNTMDLKNVKISELKEVVLNHYKIESSQPKRTKTLSVYTDGSHFKNGGSGRKGFGVYFEPIESQNILKNISIEINEAFMAKEFNLTKQECEVISNPTMEIAACSYALKSLSENKDKIEEVKEIIMYADYEGVQKWLSGEWKITKSYIKKIVDKIKAYQKDISERGIEVKYIWLKGHNGNYGNEMADKLAKGLIKE